MTNTADIIRFVFYYLTLFFIVRVPFIFWGGKNVKTAVSLLVAIPAAIFIVFRLLQQSPMIIESAYPFLYWIPVYPDWMKIMTGIVSLAVVGVFIVVFVGLGYTQRQNTIVYKRSMYLVAGMVFMAIGSVIRFFVEFQIRFASYVFSSLIVAVGLIIMAEGILQKERDQYGS